MNIILLPAGIIAGAVIGYLTAGRKAAALKTQVEAAGEREALLNRTAEERIAPRTLHCRGTFAGSRPPGFGTVGRAVLR